MRLDFLVDLLIYDNTTPNNDPANNIKVKSRIQEETITESLRHFPKVVSDGAVDEVIALPENPSDFILFLTNQEVSVKVNGSATDLTLKPKTTGVITPVFMMRGDITGLTISNASGNDANVDVVIVNI